MVHGVQYVDMEVGQIAWHEERQYLSPAILKYFIPACPAIHNQIDGTRILAFADDILAALQWNDSLNGERLNGIFTCFTERNERVQFADKELTRHKI